MPRPCRPPSRLTISAERRAAPLLSRRGDAIVRHDEARRPVHRRQQRAPFAAWRDPNTDAEAVLSLRSITRTWRVWPSAGALTCSSPPTQRDSRAGRHRCLGHCQRPSPRAADPPLGPGRDDRADRPHLDARRPLTSSPITWRGSSPRSIRSARAARGAEPRDPRRPPPRPEFQPRFSCARRTVQSRRRRFRRGRARPMG